jgi:hypothetical protein
MNLSIQENGGRSSSLSLVEYPNEHKIDKRLSRISSYVSALMVYVILSIPTALLCRVVCYLIYTHTNIAMHLACRDNDILVLEV